MARGAPRPLEFDSPAERAAAELRGWLEAGERVVALLAPRGALRRRAFESLAASLEGRFVAARWTGDQPAALRAGTAKEVRGQAPRTLLLVEDGERLGAEGARVLRALVQDPAADHCVAVALEPAEAGVVLGGLGPGMEIVVLREAPLHGGRLARVLRVAAFAAALILAGVSLGVGLAVLLPRFGPSASAPSPAREAAPAALPLPAVAAPPAPATDIERVPPPAPAPRAERRAAKPAAAPAPEHAPAPERTPAPAADPSPAVASATPSVGGWLVVNAIPRARISLDGASLGETPIVRHPVSGGSHRVSAQFEDGRSDERRVEISGGELYLMFDGRAR
jgi:hypothetical protein